METLNNHSIEKPEFCSEVTRKTRSVIKAVTISGKGDPMLTFDEKAAKSYRLLEQKGVKPAGHTFGVYYLNRGEVGVENVEWDACVPITEDVEFGGGMEIKQFPEAEVVATTLTGGYDLIGPALKYLEAVAQANGIKTKWPLTEVYIEEGEKPVTELQYLVEEEK